MGIIYCAENLVNRKKYIGKTLESLEKRKGRHIQNAFQYKRNGRFYDALRKYGSNLFRWSILEKDISEDTLDSREIFYIEKFGTFGFGYNMTEGGSVLQGYKHSQKTKDKIGKSRNGRSNKDCYIERYGEEEGLKKYQGYLKILDIKNGKGKTRLQLFIERNGEELGKELYEIFVLSIKEARRKGPTNTLGKMISLYGKEEGEKRYKIFCEKNKKPKIRKLKKEE
jgi:group I intron endonuclease